MIDPYLVPGIGGSSYSFIASLILHLIKDLSFSQTYSQANSHAHYSTYAKTQLTGKSDYDNPNPSYTYVTSKIELPPVIIEYHAINFDELKMKHPNFKYVNIVYTDADKLVIEYNHFYKNYIHIKRNKSEYWESYIELAKVSETLPKDIDSFTDLNKYQVKEFLEYRASIADYKKKEIDADKFPNNIFSINFVDILNNPEVVISTLEKMTGKKHNNSLLESYKNYIESNRIFAEEHYSLLPK